MKSSRRRHHLGSTILAYAAWNRRTIAPASSKKPTPKGNRGRVGATKYAASYRQLMSSAMSKRLALQQLRSRVAASTRLQTANIGPKLCTASAPSMRPNCARQGVTETRLIKCPSLAGLPRPPHLRRIAPNVSTQRSVPSCCSQASLSPQVDSASRIPPNLLPFVYYCTDSEHSRKNCPIALKE